MRSVVWGKLCAPASLLAVMGCLLLAAGELHAQRLEPPNPNPAGAKHYRGIADGFKKEAAELSTKYAKASDEFKQAAADCVAALEAEATALEHMALASEGGGRPAMDIASEEQRQAQLILNRCHGRLRALEEQAKHLDEQYLPSMRRETPESAKPQFEEYLKARKRAAMAQGKLANALKPDANPAGVGDLRDEAEAAERASYMASRIWHSACKYDALAQKAKATGSKELAAKLQDLIKSEAELFAAKQQDSELRARIEKLTRESQQAHRKSGELLHGRRNNPDRP